MLLIVVMVPNLQREKYSYVLIQFSCPLTLYCVQNTVDHAAWQKEENVELPIKTLEENKTTPHRSRRCSREGEITQFRQAANLSKGRMPHGA